MFSFVNFIWHWQRLGWCEIRTTSFACPFPLFNIRSIFSSLCDSFQCVLRLVCSSFNESSRNYCVMVSNKNSISLHSVTGDRPSNYQNNFL